MLVCRFQLSVHVCTAGRFRAYCAIIAELVGIQQDRAFFVVHASLTVQDTLCLQPCIVAVMIPAAVCKNILESDCA